MESTRTQDPEVKETLEPAPTPEDVKAKPPTGAAAKARVAVVELRFKAKGHLTKYSGFDGANQVSAEDGGILVVSPAKAKSLMADFPGQFVEVKPGAAAAAEKEIAEEDRKRIDAERKEQAAKEAAQKKAQTGSKPRVGGRK